MSIHQACANGAVADVALMLGQGTPVDARDDHGWTPLHVAASCSQLAVVELLLSRGASTNLVHDKGATPLLCAANKPNAAVVARLLGAGADVHKAAANGWTALHFAAAFGHVELVTLLLDRGAKIDAADPDGITPLHQAARDGRAIVVARLLERGATREARTRSGSTPLHHAAEYERLDCIDQLVAYGADVNAAATDGTTPLHRAAGARAEAVARLLAAGADPNRVSAQGVTPLAHAAREGFTRCAKALLDGGAHLDIANLEGGTALFSAAVHARRDVIALLVERGANLDAPIATGATPRASYGAGLAAALPCVALPVSLELESFGAVEATRLYFERKRGGHPLVRDLLSANWWVLHRPDGPPGSARGAPIVPEHGPSLLLFHDRPSAERFQRELVGLPAGLSCTEVEGATLFSVLDDSYDEIAFDPPIEPLPFVFYKRAQLGMLRRTGERLRLEADLRGVPSRGAIIRASRHQPYAVVRVMDSLLAFRHGDRTLLVVITSDEAATALARTFVAAAPLIDPAQQSPLWAKLGRSEAQTVSRSAAKIFGLTELPVDGAILDPAGPDLPIVLSIEDCERIALEE